MRKLLLLLSLVIASFCVNAQVSVTASAGTPGPTPYTTLKLAFDAINAGTHQGAITIDVSANTTEGTTPAVLNSTGAGSAVYTSVSIRPSVDGVSISGNPATGRGVIELNGADNVTIDGDNPNSGGTNRNLTVANTAAAATTYTMVIRIAAAASVITSANGNAIQNCIINGSATGLNTSATTSTTGSGNLSYGIYAGGSASIVAATTAPTAISSSTAVLATGGTISNLIINNNLINAAARGVAVQGSSATVATGLQITNNTIGAASGNTTNVYSMGITAQGSSSGTISGNTVSVESFLGTGIRGIDIGSISSVTGDIFTIEKNTVNNVNNRGTGTFGAYGINIVGGTGNVIQNNFVYGITGDITGGGAFSTTFGMFGIRIGSNTNHKVYHNTVNLSGTRVGLASATSLLSASFAIVATTSTGLDIRNNIFSNTQSGGASSLAYVSLYLPTSGTSSMNLILNNNAYYTGSTSGVHGIAHIGTTYTAVPAGSTTYAGLYATGSFNSATTTPASGASANLRAYSSLLSASGTNDNVSFATSSAAPFVSSSNLRISTGLTATQLESGGVSAGTTGVTVDFDGEARPGPAVPVNGGSTAPDIGADEFDGVPLSLCAVPTAQATSLNLTPTATTITGLFTAASPAPTNYLVLRTATNVAPAPVDGTSYSVGNSVPLGAYVESNSNSLSFNSTGLTAGTQYFYWVFSFNTGTCTGGPIYYTTSPLTNSATTTAIFTSIATGNWEDGATWNQSGAVPTSANDIIIASTHNVTVNAAAASGASLTINTGGTLTVSGNALSLTGLLSNSGTVVASGGTVNVIASSTAGITNAASSTFTVSGGTINLGITNNSVCNRTFTNNGTFTVSSGIVNVYGNITNGSSAVFNQSGGSINIDGNAGGVLANSVAGGTALLQFTQLNSGINLTGGTLTIVDPHASATTSNVIGCNNGTAGTQTSLAAHTTRFGDGVSTDAGGNVIGFNIDNWTGTTYLALGSIEVNGPAGTNRGFTSTYQFAAHGNVTVNNGGVLNTGSLIFAGNLTVNAGAIYNSTTAAIAGQIASNTGSGLTFGPATIAQTITNSGIIRNNATTPTANFTAFQVLNSNVSGVTFGSGIQSPTFSGAITVSTGTVNAAAFTLQGTAAQAVALTALTSFINVTDFTLANAGATATLSGSGFLNVTGKVSFGNVNSATLATGGRLVLKSTSATTTARIADVTNAGTNTGNSVTGITTIERYIPGGKRAYRFLAHPFNAAMPLTQLTDDIDITGNASDAASPGFTATGTNSPSAYSYNPVTGDGSPTNDIGWIPYTTAAGTVAAGTGFRVLVRGTKGQTGSLTGGVYVPSPVTLSASGTISNTAANVVKTLTYEPGKPSYNLVGNPYASQVNLKTVTPGAGVNNNFWIWNVNQGTKGGYLAYAFGTNDYSLPSGASFFGQAIAAAANTYDFHETDKTATDSSTMLRNNGAKRNILEMNVSSNNVFYDRYMLHLDSKGSADKDARWDAAKMQNAEVNLYGLSKDIKKLSIDVRPFEEGAIIPLGFTNDLARNYTFSFPTYELEDNVDMYLHDKYLSTYTKLKEGVTYTFNTSSDAASYGDNRFELSMKQAPVLVPIATTFSVKLSPNPARDMVNVSFSNEEQANTTISITNAEGKSVRTVNAGNVQSGNISINVKGMAKGTYYVTLNNGKNKKTEKLQVQ